jgi:hypothetical protein
MKTAKRLLIILPVVFAIILLATLRRTPLGVGFLVPSAFAQGFGINLCTGPFVAPVYAINLRNSVDQVFQWGCFDASANLMIAGTVHVAVQGDGVSDDYAVLQNAINGAIYTNNPRVSIPCGKVLIKTALNLTNIQGLEIKGCSPMFGGFGENGITNTNVTELRGNTGTVVLDITGSSQIRIKDIEIRVANTYATPSKIGILMARDDGGAGGGSSNPFCFSQFNILENVFIWMDSSAAVTTRGRVALYNVGAEHFTIHGGLFRGDSGAYFSNSNQLAFTGPYQTIQTGCPSSMTDVKVLGGTSFAAAGANSGLELGGTQLINFEFDNIHILNVGTATYAMSFNTSSSGAIRIQVSGQFEGFPSCMNSNGDLHDSTFNIVCISPTSNLVGINANVTHQNNWFHFVQVGGAAQNLFSSGSSSTIQGGVIFAGSSLGMADPGINSPNITLTNALVFDLGATSNPTLAAGSDYTLMNGNGTQFTKGLSSGAVTFANLGTPANGFIKYCSDCTIANPCAGSGTGAIAKRLNGAWSCL